jgi:hypothetical protein
MSKVVSLRFGTMFKKAFSDREVFSGFASDVLGLPIQVDAVHQEYRYPEPVGRVNVTYDLFAEDVGHRVIVEVQHIREPDFFDRFLHYHAVSIVEQVTSHGDYRTGRTVYTVVVLTTAPRDDRLQFSLAVSDMDPVNEQGKRLGVYRHRLVFLNPRNVNDQTPPAAKAWMDLITDSLDGEMDEKQYTSPLMRRVIDKIRDDAISPDELERVKDEAAWERALREGRQDGRLEGELAGELRGVLQGELKGRRAALLLVARTLGLVLDDGDRARIEACENVATLDRWLARLPGAKRVADALD